MSEVVTNVRQVICSHLVAEQKKHGLTDREVADILGISNELYIEFARENPNKIVNKVFGKISEWYNGGGILKEPVAKSTGQKELFKEDTAKTSESGNALKEKAPESPVERIAQRICLNDLLEEENAKRVKILSHSIKDGNQICLQVLVVKEIIIDLNPVFNDEAKNITVNLREGK